MISSGRVPITTICCLNLSSRARVLECWQCRRFLKCTGVTLRKQCCVQSVSTTYSRQPQLSRRFAQHTRRQLDSRCDCTSHISYQRQGFCLTGKAAHVPAKNSVYLCPGGSSGGGTSPKATPTTSAPRPSTGPLGSGSLWFTSGREVARGFSTVVAFRCDRAKPKSPANRRSAAIEQQRQDGEGRDDVAERGRCGRISFVVHHHRAALSGDGGGHKAEGRSSLAIVPNSLSVCLDLNGTGGGEVSLRWLHPHILVVAVSAAVFVFVLSDFRVTSSWHLGRYGLVLAGRG